jgi:hypothetical protein
MLKDGWGLIWKTRFGEVVPGRRKSEAEGMGCETMEHGGNLKSLTLLRRGCVGQGVVASTLSSSQTALMWTKDLDFVLWVMGEIFSF